jgi:5-methylcytosine-specific restriction endonuclease McrA
MKGIRSKAGQLHPVSYENLRQRVLCRDGWRCQSCGTMSKLEVHHQQFRSHAGKDSEQNLITLCSKCHMAIHCGPSVRGRQFGTSDSN